MRDSLVAHGIPDSVIILDYDGTRTLNSIVKAKEIYGVDCITLFHKNTTMNGQYSSLLKMGLTLLATMPNHHTTKSNA